MHFSTALAAAAAVAPLVSAHGSGVPLPRIVGLNPRDLKARDLLSSLGARFTEVHEFQKEGALKARQADDRECGAGVGSCAAGLCCSQAGYCGNDPDYCYSPGCDYKYGPACPDNATPAGTNTSSIARTKVGKVLYGGEGVYNCQDPGAIALTYDDGPAKTLTAHILDLMKTYNAKATFFITGNNINKGQIDLTQEYIDVIKRMDAEGHQIASHTWTHLDLSAISQIDRKNQMWKNEMALRNIVGKIPTYMRPPYSSCTGQCETDMAALGYHVIYFDVDTDDYNQDDPSKIQKSKDWFTGNITANGATAAGGATWLDIQHDIHVQTANNLTEYMLQTITKLGYKAVTVGECLGDPVANWYRTAGGAGTPASSSTRGTATRSSSAPASTGTKAVTTDATCGGTKGYTCLNSAFGNCCSASGWCGSTTDYCGTGCQASFGNCGSNGGVSSKAASSTMAPVASTPKPASSTKASSAAPPTSTKKASTDGTCAGTKGFTCSGSTFGTCCSAYGWCGSTTDHCGSGCQSAFGTCSGSGGGASSAPAASPSATKKVSTDGSCAGTSGFTCTNSSFGNCCSQYGWCGSTTGHCGTGCNKSFGTCT